MFHVDSIANKLRLSYLVFAILLCVTFVSIFLYAEMRIEQELVKGRLLQQLQLSQETQGEQPIYVANPDIKIYRYDNAPENLKAIANETVQEIRVTVSNKAGKTETNLHFFAYRQNDQNYILTYLIDI